MDVCTTALAMQEMDPVRSFIQQGFPPISNLQPMAPTESQNSLSGMHRLSERNSQDDPPPISPLTSPKARLARFEGQIPN